MKTATGAPAPSRVARGCMLRAADVADLIGISDRTLWRLVEKGSFPKPDVRLSRKLVRWSVAVVRQWLEEIGGQAR